MPEDRKKAMTELRKVIQKNIPKGFKETMGYGNLGWVVPHSFYHKITKTEQRTILKNGCEDWRGELE